MTKTFEGDFYLVWCPQGGVPMHKHYTFGEAEAEAIRLLQKSPSPLLHFHVMRCAATVKFGDMVITRHAPAIPEEFSLKKSGKKNPKTIKGA